MLYLFYAVIFLVCLYMVRHYVFTLNRLFGAQRHPYLDVNEADWPRVTVLIPAHNEEAVIAVLLDALLESDYEKDKLRILPINDRSEDRTREIVDRFAERHPGRITPFHRSEGNPGKAAALQDAMELVDDDIFLVFDADYIPGKGLIKQLVAPFFDPEVGATMGRVVPHNVKKNLLTRICDLERAGGYQVDQQARMNLLLVPQYGGTVGGIRKQALLNAGGWRTDALAEDTDATFRLLLDGWKVVYQNRSECYEQAPTTWGMRMRQIMRWARGHNQVMARYAGRLLFNRRIRLREKLDGMMLLHIYLLSPVLLIGWGLGLVLWFLGVSKPGLIIILAVTCYSTLGNFAIFFEISTACHLDGSKERIRLLPFIFLGFLISLVAVTRATLTQVLYRPFSSDVLWHKTEHGPVERTWK
ncbi:MAG: glycosyltransferase family 2 protein [Acidobacteria bacterium]|uniref:Glycosyltransferase family 2 protein n=1 Tax=Candidatus Polarisedimenticola svalbardensis TaxID=2886004 RepID=A0A8J6Y1Q3_9BACT|nr:glycosyltransferase family 2 protein [Candidatus Polarisedimenticola svalbardensis]